MKKKYTKPELFFESYMLTTSIASGCDSSFDKNNFNHSDINSCVMYFGRRRTIIFTSENGACENQYVDGQEGLCYQTTGGTGMIVFSS